MDRLVQLLGDEKADVRGTAFTAILAGWDSWNAQDLELLGRKARDADAEVARRATEAVSRIRIRRRAGRQILENVKDLDAALSLAGEDDRLWALKEVGRLSLKQPLDPQSVANVLDIAGVPPLQSKAGELTAFVEEYHLTSFAPVIVPFLTDDRAEIRRNTIWALGWIGFTPVAGKIADRVEQDPIASCALGVLGATRYSDLIQKNLRHANPDFRRAALAGLMELGAPIAGEEVLVLFKDEDALTRGLAALTWTVVGGTERARQISPLLKDPDASVRGNAVWALYFLGAREFFEDVRLLLRDPAEPVRGAASVFVSKYSETLSDAAKDGLSLEIQEAAPKIGIEKWIASVNLGNAPPRNLRRFLLDMAKPEHSAWRKHGICLLDALSRTLEPAAYRKLTKRGELPHSIDSMDDARRYFRSLGPELETLGPAAMGGRMNAGVVADGLTLITNRFKVGSYGFVLHQDRIVVMPWEEAMRDWIRKIGRE